VLPFSELVPPAFSVLLPLGEECLWADDELCPDLEGLALALVVAGELPVEASRAGDVFAIGEFAGDAPLWPSVA